MKFVGTKLAAPPFRRILYQTKEEKLSDIKDTF